MPTREQPVARFPNYEIVFEDAEIIRIADRGPWDFYPTVTNRAEEVVAELVREGNLRPGMRLFYYDSEGEFSQILLEGGRFAGFKHAVE